MIHTGPASEFHSFDALERSTEEQASLRNGLQSVRARGPRIDLSS